MRRALVRTTSFTRAARRLVKKDPDLAEHLRAALTQLSEDAFHPNLRTHKLKGLLEGLWACRAGHDLRILFSFEKHEGEEAILLQTCGTHDEVY